MPRWRDTVDLMGRPLMPSVATGTRAFNATRARLRWLLGASVPASLHVIESLLALADNRVLGLLVEFDIPEALARPRTIGDLAEITGAHAPALARVMRYAAGRGFVKLRRDGRYKASRVTKVLQRDRANSWRGWVEFAGSDWFWSGWRHLDEAVRGKAPGIEVAVGADFFAWAGTERPDAGVAFHDAMRAGSTLQAFALSHTLSWDNVSSVCDVGGGTGAALEVLLRHHERLHGTLFDLVEVVAQARPALVDGDIAARVTLTGGDFFTAVPPGCDRYMLLAIIHDWDDDHAMTILRRVRDALHPSACAVVVEQVLPDRPRSDFAFASDLLMMVFCSGRERTRPELDALFSASGLEVERAVGLPTGFTAFVLR